MKNINLEKDFKSFVPSEYSDVISECSKIANDNGYKIFLIGGFVRDLIMKNPIRDIDITVQGNAPEFSGLLRHFLNAKTVKIQNDLETVRLKFPNGVEVDFASTRDEFYPAAGNLPVVKSTGCELAKDVLRRDFTINSIALSLSRENIFDLIDYTDGYEDIFNKKIKILHKKSFTDDPSRIIRAFKFCARFGFDLDKETKILRDKYLENIPENLPFERIKSELKSIFDYNNPEFFDKFFDEKLYKIFGIIPTEFCKGKKISEKLQKYGIQEDEKFFFWLAPSFTGAKPPAKLNLTTRENKILRDMNGLLKTEEPVFTTKYDIYKFFRSYDKYSVILYDIFRSSESAELYLSELADMKLEISGKDLLSLISPGEIYSEILEKVLKKKINEGFDSKSAELNFARTVVDTIKPKNKR